MSNLVVNRAEALLEIMSNIPIGCSHLFRFNHNLRRFVSVIIRIYVRIFSFRIDLEKNDSSRFHQSKGLEVDNLEIFFHLRRCRRSGLQKFRLDRRDVSWRLHLGWGISKRLHRRSHNKSGNGENIDNVGRATKSKKILQDR